MGRFWVTTEGKSSVKAASGGMVSNTSSTRSVRAGAVRDSPIGAVESRKRPRYHLEKDLNLPQ